MLYVYCTKKKNLYIIILLLLKIPILFYSIMEFYKENDFEEFFSREEKKFLKSSFRKFSFKEYFTIENSKKNRKNVVSLDCLDNYNIFSNKGKRPQLIKKNTSANFISSKEIGYKTIDNTIIYINNFFSNINENDYISNDSNYIDFFNSLNIDNSFFDNKKMNIFLMLKCHKKTKIKVPDSNYLVKTFLKSKNKKKILKVPVFYSFFYKSSTPGILFFSEQRIIYWLESEIFNLSS